MNFKSQNFLSLYLTLKYLPIKVGIHLQGLQINIYNLHINFILIFIYLYPQIQI